MPDERDIIYTLHISFYIYDFITNISSLTGILYHSIVYVNILMQIIYTDIYGAPTDNVYAIKPQENGDHTTILHD